MPEAVTFTVSGMVPAPQGSKRALGPGRMIESCKRLKPWRALVTSTAQSLGVGVFSGPISLSLTFLLPRPKCHFNKSGLKASAPRWHAVKPDNDKLIRAVCDALTGSLIVDDSKVVSVASTKRYTVGDEQPGVIVTVVGL